MPILDPERREKPLLLQVLCATVWDNPLLPLCLKWRPSRGNTLLITDQLVQGILNPLHSLIYIPCFHSIYECSIILEDIIFLWLMKWKESNTRTCNFIEANQIGLPKLSASVRIGLKLIWHAPSNLLKDVTRFI